MEKIVVLCVECEQKLRIPKEGNIEIVCPKCKSTRIFMRDVDGINIVVLGKSGVGKSEFCNYVFNTKVFRSGSGKPVTTWDENFQHHFLNYDNYSLNIYDSVGIENTNIGEWQNKLNQFLDLRSFSNSKPKKWVHGIFYLINAASARIEDKEISIIKNLLSRHIPIQIVFTKVDQARSEELEALKSQIRKIEPDLGLHEVCSVTVKKRVGSVERYGRENVLNGFLADLDEKLKYGILQYSLIHYVYGMKELSRKLRSSIEASDFGLFSLIKEIYSDSNREIDEIFNIDSSAIDQLGKESEDALNELDAFLLSYGYTSENSARKELDRIQAEIDQHLDDMDNHLNKKLEEIEDKFGGGAIDKISGFFEVAKILFGIKSFILEMIDDMANPMIAKLELEAKKYGVK